MAKDLCLSTFYDRFEYFIFPYFLMTFSNYSLVMSSLRFLTKTRFFLSISLFYSLNLALRSSFFSKKQTERSGISFPSMNGVLFRAYIAFVASIASL